MITFILSTPMKHWTCAHLGSTLICLSVCLLVYITCKIMDLHQKSSTLRCSLLYAHISMCVCFVEGEQLPLRVKLILSWDQFRFSERRESIQFGTNNITDVITIRTERTGTTNTASNSFWFLIIRSTQSPRARKPRSPGTIIYKLYLSIINWRMKMLTSARSKHRPQRTRINTLKEFCLTR